MNDFLTSVFGNVRVRAFEFPFSIVRTMEMFRNAGNYVFEQVSYLGNDDNPVTPSVNEIQEQVYHDIRAKFKLKSQMAIFVCRQVSPNYVTFVKQIEEPKREVERRYYGKRKPKVIKWHVFTYQL